MVCLWLFLFSEGLVLSKPITYYITYFCVLLNINDLWSNWMAIDRLGTTASDISQPLRQVKLWGPGEELVDIVERVNKIVAII